MLVDQGFSKGNDGVSFKYDGGLLHGAGYHWELLVWISQELKVNGYTFYLVLGWLNLPEKHKAGELVPIW